VALGGEPECYVDSDCNDTDECTTDTCVGGVCYNDPITCDDSNACTADSCDPLTGCVYDPITCDDGDACTTDSCDTVTGCVFDPVVCDPGYYCDNGICIPEGCDNDGTCETGEDCNNCPNDCISGSGGCGNGVCEPTLGEDCLSCPGDCAGFQTGKPSGRYCCGDGDGVNPVGCGDARCTSGGYQCSSTPAAYCCGDLACEGAETPYNCAIDCGPPPVCPDGTCDLGEDQCSCPADCGTPPSTETSCTDGVDNDCDTLTDCLDTVDCGTDPACVCLARGETCTLDSECCSNRCHRGACK
jgi:hypothetical protein